MNQLFGIFRKLLSMNGSDSLLDWAIYFRSKQQRLYFISRGRDENAESQLWVFHCKDGDLSETETCPHTLYSDQEDLVSLTRFAKALQIHNVVRTSSESNWEFFTNVETILVEFN